MDRCRRFIPHMYVAAGLMALCWPQETPAQWRPGGVPVCTSPKNQEYPFVLEDGRGGVFVAWRDQRDSAVLGFDIDAACDKAAVRAQCHRDRVERVVGRAEGRRLGDLSLFRGR